MMDLSSFGLSEEQLAGITEAYETDVTGLKNTVNSLKGEKLSAQQLAEEANQAVKDKQTALQLAEEEKLKLAGDMDGLKSHLKAHYEKQNAEALASANSNAEKAQALIKQRDTNETKATILSKVDPAFKDFADALLTQNLTVSYDKDGKLVKEFNTGDGVVGTEADFLSWASEKSEAWKRVLIAANSSGASTQQSAFQSVDKSDMSGTKQERINAAVKANPALSKLPIR